MAELLRDLADLEKTLPYDSDDASLIRVTRRDWEKARRVTPDLAARLTQTASEAMEAWVLARAAGDFSALGTWLRENLNSLGRKLTPKETLERVAGGPIDPEPYLRYLQGKHGVEITA